MLARVSNIETFRRWRLDEDASLDDIIKRLTDFQPTEAMLAGTAFHKALETAQEGEHGALESNGYVFQFEDDADIAVPEIKELRAYKEYGPLTVTGQVDCLVGNRIEDHKTTGYFRPDGYLEGCQWRFYLDIFGCDVFRWNVFQVKADRKRPNFYTVQPPQFLEQCRYPAMHEDCARLAADYYEFASRYLPSDQSVAA